MQIEGGKGSPLFGPLRRPGIGSLTVQTPDEHTPLPQAVPLTGWQPRWAVAAEHCWHSPQVGHCKFGREQKDDPLAQWTAVQQRNSAGWIQGRQLRRACGAPCNAQALM